MSGHFVVAAVLAIAHVVTPTQQQPYDQPSTFFNAYEGRARLSVNLGWHLGIIRTYFL